MKQDFTAQKNWEKYVPKLTKKDLQPWGKTPVPAFPGTTADEQKAALRG